MVFTEERPGGAAPSETGGDPPTVEELVAAFLVVMNRLGRHLFERSAEFDLPPQQAKAFHELRQPMAMSDLADRLLCDASNVTGIIDRLEARGLVERHPDPDDRRVRRLVLTPAGRELWQAHHDRVYTDCPYVDTLDGDDRRTLHRLLRKMAEAGD